MIDFGNLEIAIKRLNNKIVIAPNTFQAVYTINGKNIGSQADNVNGHYITNLIRLDKYETILLEMQNEKNYETQSAVDNLTNIINRSSVFLKKSYKSKNHESSLSINYTITVNNRGVAQLIQIEEVRVSKDDNLKQQTTRFSNSSINILTFDSQSTYQSMLQSLYLSIKITEMKNFAESGKHDFMLEKLNNNAKLLKEFMTKHGIAFKVE